MTCCTPKNRHPTSFSFTSYTNMSQRLFKGGIASGKSTVSKLLEQLGCPVIDADKVAREVVEPGTMGWRKIKKQFGMGVFHEDGQLNREKLGEIIFSQPEKRHLLNQITHPEIYKSIAWKVAGYFITGHQFVILDVPLLFETDKMTPYMAFTVVVSCSEAQQLQRLMQRNSLTQEEAQNRIESQMPLAEKCQKATYVIDNSGTLENTKQQVDDIYLKLRNSRSQWKVQLLILPVIILLIAILVYIVKR